MGLEWESLTKEVVGAGGPGLFGLHMKGTSRVSCLHSGDWLTQAGAVPLGSAGPQEIKASKTHDKKI